MQAHHGEIAVARVDERRLARIRDQDRRAIRREEAEEMQALVRTEMESAASFSVPIVADVGLGDNWRDIK